MTPRNFSPLARLGSALFALGLLAGCADSPLATIGAHVPTYAQIQTALGRPDNYIYYPGYGVYYNTAKHQYVYCDNYDWMTREYPPEDVTVEMLQSAPWVAMDFHDSPKRHDVAVRRNYPRSAKLPAAAVASTP